MYQYILKRVLMMFPVLLAVTIIVFSIVHLIPGDPVRLVVGEMASQQAYDRVRAELGLDKPLYIQYFLFSANYFTLTWGNPSFIERRLLNCWQPNYQIHLS